MSDEFDASASGDALAGDEGSNDPLSGLEAYFSRSAETETDESEQVEIPAADDAQEPAQEEAATEAETPSEDAAKADDATDAEAETEEAADFDALEKSGEFLDDPKDLKAKFPRNSSNELIAEMAEYGKAAKRGAEVIDAIGGESYVSGVTTLATGLKAGDPNTVFTGIVETAGAEELVKIIGQAVYLGLVKSDEMSANPETSQFGNALSSIVNGALQERFGPEMSVERMGKLAQWDQAGWFEKIEKWVTESYVDHDEVSELLSTTNNPDLLAAKKENERLKAELAQKDTKADESAAVQQTQIENSFGTKVADGIGTTLTGVVWAKSPLRELATDSDELKQEKAFLRTHLTEKAVANFRSGDAYAKLLADFRTGKGGSAVFADGLAKAINQAVLGTREGTAVAERLLAKIYGKSRNSQLAKKPAPQQNDDADAGRKPTETTNFGNEGPATREDIMKDLQSRIAALP